ncbi:MAG TPA: PQQ-binding-like beta-propeller repeat protein [Phycisphaerae bacterium]|nr:PQQ-binding-like beta-propeller repeat protein [Phycisphaerae bacterium]
MPAVRAIVASATLLAFAAAAALLPGCTEKPTTMAAPVPVELPGLHEAGLHQDWTRSVHLEPGERIKKAWHVGGSIYVATTSSRIIRIDAKTGLLVWSNGLGPENFDIFKPIELKDAAGGPVRNVLVVTRGEAFVFDMETGDESQPPAQMGMSVSTDPILIGNTLGVGAADGFYGLYFDQLKLKHWRLPAVGDLFDSAPVAVDSNILLASRSGKLWRINADNGDWDWKDRKTNGEVVAGLAADFGALYVPSLDQRVYAFDAATGGELWEQQLAGRLETTPVIAGSNLLVISSEQGMYALAKDTGEVKWHVPEISSVATVSDDTVWVGDTMGNIKLLNVSDGAQRAYAAVPGVQFFINNTLDKRVFIVGQGGVIAAYSENR